MEVSEMALIRWSPTSDLMNLHSEMDRLFGDLTQNVWQPTRGAGNGGTNGQAFLPLDIERTDKALVIQASVPGFSPDEVSVTVEGGVLTIDAQRQQESEKKERNVIRQERFHGRLYRQVFLGEGINGEGAEATFKDGVLTVTVPLASRPEPKKIPIQTKQS
jgi:HSP20 family protein